MTTIDLATGLPALEENQFWRVRIQGASPYHGPRPECVVVELVEKITTERVYPRFILGIQFGSHGPIKQTDFVTQAEQVLWDPKHEPSESYNGWVVNVNGEKYLPISPEAITPSLILEGAKAALEWYNSKKTSLGYLGDYPPNRLPAVENA